jgi:hypothetical protein
MSGSNPTPLHAAKAKPPDDAKALGRHALRITPVRKRNNAMPFPAFMSRGAFCFLFSAIPLFRYPLLLPLFNPHTANRLFICAKATI